MKFKYLAIVCAAIMLLAARGYAQGPKELSASSARQWNNYSSTNGFTIKLPDFFKQGTASSSGAVEYQPADAKNNGIILFISRVGDASSVVLRGRYNQLISSLKHNEDRKIELKKLSIKFFVVSSTALDDDQFDKNGREQKYFWYARGVMAPTGVYEISIRYQPEYRKAITAIIPRIAASFSGAESIQ